MRLDKYIDFAENDYNYFKASYEAGIVANAMGALAQNICEKYLKHIVDQYYIPQSNTENEEKQNMLRTHNLQKLLSFMKKNMSLSCDRDTENNLLRINGYYFTTRYPGDDSIELDENDIADCITAVSACRDMTFDYIKLIEQNIDEKVPSDNDEPGLD